MNKLVVFNTLMLLNISIVAWDPIFRFWRNLWWSVN
jgi:hypothetical protein